MAAHKLNLDTFELMAFNLQLNELLKLGASCVSFRLMTMRVAELSVASELQKVTGVGLHWVPDNKCPLCIPSCVYLKAALRPSCLIKGYTSRWPNMTIPFPFTLESKGPLFLEFRLIAAKAPNGTPKIGVLDADCCSDWVPAHWLGDFTSGQGSAQQFAIAYAPCCGTLCATTAALQGESVPRPPGSKPEQQEYFRAALNWEPLGDWTRKWNAPVHAGLFIKNGCLTFYRRVTDTFWHSSGVICDCLPDRVLPCVFMDCFSGYSRVDFVQVKSNPPTTCSGCDHLGHGLHDGWWRLVRRCP